MSKTEANQNEKLVGWLRGLPLGRRIRAALLRDLELDSADSQLAGLDPDSFAVELLAANGGRVARVTGIGDKALASLRRTVSNAGTAKAPPAAAAQVNERTADDALAAITAAADGLLVPSESDSPFEPFRWAGPAPLKPEALLAELKLPPDAPVETRALDTFFAPLATAADWMDEAQRAQAARFGALRDEIAARLRDVVVYRLGRIRITVVIAGEDAAGTTVGLRTTLVET